MIKNNNNKFKIVIKVLIKFKNMKVLMVKLRIFLINFKTKHFKMIFN